MELQLKQNPENIPLDEYGVECPNAYVKDTFVDFDFSSQTLTVGWAMYRDKEEADRNGKTIKQGIYTWTKEEKPAVYNTVLATYDEDTPATYDEDNNELTPFIKGAEITPEIKTLLTPKFGAFSNVTNISVTVNGTDFGEQGEIWVKAHIEWKDFEIIK